MSIVSELEPQKVFTFFEELTRIPRGSGHIRAVSDHLKYFAISRGFEASQDDAGNVVVKLPASPGREDLEPLILQGHMDMVAVKDKDSETDPERDPLKLVVDGDLLYAEGTSLGGDDGIAIAYFCALMDDRTIEHPELILVMTADEETGMDGARALDPSYVSRGRLINIDSEEEGVFLAGCAGGGRVHISLQGKLTRRSGDELDIRICGLQGGHSGQEADKGRGNANIIAGRLLKMLSDDRCRFSIAGISGGTADNAIPSEAQIRLVVPAGYAANTAHIESVIRDAQDIIGTELGIRDPELRFVVEKPEETVNLGCASDELEKNIVTLLNIVPNGVISMSADMEGLVETSLNLGMIEYRPGYGSEGVFAADFSVRSSLTSARDRLIDRLKLIAECVGGEASVHGLYPGWAYDPESVILSHMSETWKRIHGEAPEIKAIHAGVECGLFREKREDLDCVSFGPDLEDVHSTKEKLHIASAGRIWEFLLEVLRSWDRKNN